MEEFRYSHTTTVGRTKSVLVDYYYSNYGRCKIIKNNEEKIFVPKYKGCRGERIYITIVKLFPEICGFWYEGCEVDHIDTNRFNNSAENLRVCTPKENMNNPLTKQHCKDAMYKRIKSGVYKNVFRCHSAWNKGMSGEQMPMFGKHHTVETKMKMSLSAKNRKKYNGENI